jgi:hypothetical protein
MRRDVRVSRGGSVGEPRPGGPLYRRLARKEVRLREDQYVALSRLVGVLVRRRVRRNGPRLTENTLIRVAIDLLLSRSHRLLGDTESELRQSVLNGDGTNVSTHPTD